MSDGKKKCYFVISLLEKEAFGVFVFYNIHDNTKYVDIKNMLNDFYATVGVVDDGKILSCTDMELSSVLDTVVFTKQT